jgi:hypothetical protein
MRIQTLQDMVCRRKAPARPCTELGMVIAVKRDRRLCLVWRERGFGCEVPLVPTQLTPPLKREDQQELKHESLLPILPLYQGNIEGQPQTAALPEFRVGRAWSLWCTCRFTVVERRVWVAQGDCDRTCSHRRVRIPMPCPDVVNVPCLAPCLALISHVMLVVPLVFFSYLFFSFLFRQHQVPYCSGLSSRMTPCHSKVSECAIRGCTMRGPRDLIDTGEQVAGRVMMWGTGFHIPDQKVLILAESRPWSLPEMRRRLRG